MRIATRFCERHQWKGSRASFVNPRILFIAIVYCIYFLLEQLGDRLGVLLVALDAGGLGSADLTEGGVQGSGSPPNNDRGLLFGNCV